MATPAAARITEQLIRAEVQRYWNAFTGKDAESLMHFYAPEASVFNSSVSRSEPGRLAAARRQREYFHAGAQLRASTSALDVVLLGDTAAVASYNFQFHALKTTLSGTSEEDIQNGRATQVFAYDPDGKLRIVHEHFSLPDKPAEKH
jgi:ketosteroid isomerase-like protein